ncbi:MAG: PQQ-binding-like beta-propeller repeat protein [Gemmataceae bacterium]
MKMRRHLFGISICVYLCSSVANSSPAADWLHWRGPFQTGVSTEVGLPDKFGEDPKAPDSNVIWKAPYPCRSTPVALDGRVFVINSEGQGVMEGERVMAFDAATGKVLWEDKFNVFHADIVSARVGWSNPAGDKETGYVYAHGVQGLLTCYEGKTGKVVWRRSLTEEYGRVCGYGGRTTTPVVEGNLVIVGFINNSWGDQALRGGNRFVAFDKRTGTVVWWSDPCDRVKLTYCSCPVVATIGGQRLFITGAADGHLVALQANTGVKVWDYPVGASTLDASPVVDGSHVYITNAVENANSADQGLIVCVDAAQIENGHPKLVWEAHGIKACLSSPLVHDGRLYVADDTAMLYCYDAKTGKRFWRHKYGTASRGAPVWADGKIYLSAVNARFNILKDEGKACKVLHEHRFFSKAGGELVESNGTAAVANGRIYFGNADEFYCIGVGLEAVHRQPGRLAEGRDAEGGRAGARPGGAGRRRADAGRQGIVQGAPLRQERHLREGIAGRVVVGRVRPAADAEGPADAARRHHRQGRQPDRRYRRARAGGLGHGQGRQLEWFGPRPRRGAAAVHPRREQDAGRLVPRRLAEHAGQVLRRREGRQEDAAKRRDHPGPADRPGERVHHLLA